MRIEPSTPTFHSPMGSGSRWTLTVRCSPRSEDCSVVMSRSVKNMASSPTEIEHRTSDLFLH